jgi:hypothetical protein
MICEGDWKTLCRNSDLQMVSKKRRIILVGQTDLKKQKWTSGKELQNY